MKGIAAVVLLGIIGVATLGITMDINNVTSVKAVLDDSLTNSIWSTLKSSNVYNMYDINDQQMSVEFIRYFAENMNETSADHDHMFDQGLDIYIYNATTKGLMDIKVTGSFSHLNGENGSREVRKTLLLEKTPNSEE